MTVTTIMAIVIIISFVFETAILKAQVDRLSFKNAFLLEENHMLTIELSKRSKMMNLNKNILNKDIMDALTYARKRSHPDNGGSKEDFDKYNKIYNDNIKKG